MYDKYNKASPFTVNASLPRHKGILLNNGSATSAVVHFFNSSGGTFSATINFGAQGFSILPIEVERVASFAGGTGYLLN
jgi:hypothetical protein